MQKINYKLIIAHTFAGIFLIWALNELVYLYDSELLRIYEDIDILDDLSKVIKTSALCGLGQTGPNPVLSTLRYFKDEYEAHIYEKRCPAKRCISLLKFEVDPEVCKKCGLCFKACPTDAIRWIKKEAAIIDKDKCIKCMTCYDKCKFDAIF